MSYIPLIHSRCIPYKAGCDSMGALSRELQSLPSLTIQDEGEMRIGLRGIDANRMGFA